MKKGKKWTPVVLITLLVLMFTGIFIQGLFSVVKLESLYGYWIPPKPQKLSEKNWFSCKYQEEMTLFLNDFFGFRQLFVRINHQIGFSLFGKGKTSWVTVGKENYLYEESYIKAVYGTDFIGIDSICTRMEQFKIVQEYLATSGKTLIWILAPGKGSFYPEYIPDSYKQPKGVTNEEIYLKYADSLNINYIDFNALFKTQKHKSLYPLYPQYGIHWSFYGACLVADSIVHYIENLRQITMPHLYWNEVEVHKPTSSDMDAAKSLNLLFEPSTFDMGYPKLQYEEACDKTKPSLLVVGDSFFWILYGDLNIGRLFSDLHFWYYNKQIEPGNRPVISSDLTKALQKYDIILILGTNATLPKLSWGFIEQIYEDVNTTQ